MLNRFTPNSQPRGFKSFTKQPTLSYYSDGGVIEIERKWPLVIRYRSVAIVSQVVDNTRYNDPRECRAVLLRRS